MNKLLLSTLLISLCSIGLADKSVITMRLVSADGESGKVIGKIKTKDTKYGLILKTNLHGLTPGFHGFHIHANSSCKNFGNAAGGHLDPQHTGKHLGPYSDQGHLGDLPELYVDQQGDAKETLIAPRLNVKDIKGHALMIHAGGDNYSDHPKPLGGGGKRVACG